MPAINRRILLKLWAVLILIFLSACTQKIIPEPVTDQESAAGLANLPGDANIPIINDSQSSHLSINWGLAYIFNELFLSSKRYNEKEGASGIGENSNEEKEKILRYLNDKFNVTMTAAHYIPHYAAMAGQTLEPGMTINAAVHAANPYMAAKPQPVYDIFLTNPQLALNAGLIRTIPPALIDQYMPGYANILTLYDGWALNTADNGEYLGLSAFNPDYDRLNRFSVYRLDWLEETGFQPQGELVTLADNVFFSPEAFSWGEFLPIIQSFKKNDAPKPYRTKTVEDELLWYDLPANKNWGMSVNMDCVIPDIIPIMAMNGIQNSVVEDNGMAVPYYASLAFKSSLDLLNQLARDGYVFSYGGGTVYPEDSQMSAFADTDGSMGWASLSLSQIRLACEILRARHPEAKILITPPEEAGPGIRGAGVLQEYTAFTPERSWVIGAHVTDEKLTRILQILNAITFDYETYIAVHYGTAGEDFTWAGEPYASAVAPKRKLTTGYWYKGFDTDIVSEVSADQEAYNGFEYLYHYAKTDTARAMRGKSYNEDAWGKYQDEKTRLDGRYKQGIDAVLEKYLSDAIHPDTVMNFDIDLFWYDYINELNKNGLAEYIAFYNRT